MSFPDSFQVPDDEDLDWLCRFCGHFMNEDRDGCGCPCHEPPDYQHPEDDDDPR